MLRSSVSVQYGILGHVHRDVARAQPLLCGYLLLPALSYVEAAKAIQACHGPAWLTAP